MIEVKLGWIGFLCEVARRVDLTSSSRTGESHSLQEPGLPGVGNGAWRWVLSVDVEQGHAFREGARLGRQMCLLVRFLSGGASSDLNDKKNTAGK